MATHIVQCDNQSYKTQSYTVQVGEYQLALHRWYRREGTPVILLPDFMEDRRVFLPQGNQASLATHLADRGHDVFILELRGKGTSWPQPSRHSHWSTHELVCEDIPAQLAMVERLRPKAPQYWLGRGFGGVLLAASYLRIESLAAPVLGLVHMGVARRLELLDFNRALAYQRWQVRAWLAHAVGGQVNAFFSKAYAPESGDCFHAWCHWHNSEEWQDPKDQFDYLWAAQNKSLPSSLYLARQKGLWGQVQDCRNWIQELGGHDARLLVDKTGRWGTEHFTWVADWMADCENARYLKHTNSSKSGSQSPA